MSQAMNFRRTCVHSCRTRDFGRRCVWPAVLVALLVLACDWTSPTSGTPPTHRGHHECSGNLQSHSLSCMVPGTVDVLREVLITFAYISTDVGASCVSGIGGSYSREAVMLISCLLSLAIAVMISWWKGGRAGLVRATHPRHSVPLLPIAGLFCMGTLFNLKAIELLSPMLVKVLSQMKLPVTVCLSALMMKRHYGFLQILGLANIFFAVTAFSSLRISASHSSQGNDQCLEGGDEIRGYVFTAGGICCTVVASILAEKAFKDESKDPFYIKTANLKVGESLAAFVLATLTPGASLHAGKLMTSPLSLFEGFDHKTVVLIALLVSDGWLSGLIVKQLSSVVKSIAKCLSLIVLYLACLFIFRTETFDWPQVMLALLVVSGAGLFAYASALAKKNAHNLQRPQTEQARSLIKDAFSQYASGDGKSIKIADLQKVCETLGARKDQLTDALKELDPDDSGSLNMSLEDFNAFWSSTPGCGGYSQIVSVALRFRLGVINTT
eukprot:TRINITY_DN27912_c0_g1_i1.p1 TRINITY_DN27912_c0_g1~~TRINITY_DN27912_c0_g1_i1.p1  ORF type:complete len:497 (+),score=57.95 TRINITY_DN27912_c0_g1_i1:129-1619(+)